MDPQLASDVLSITTVENLFVQLTNFAPESDEIVAEAALSWEGNDDGTLYTFTLRTDIPWVKFDPATGSIELEHDLDGSIRYVTAEDFVYGIRRACSPDLASLSSGKVAPVIKGCSDVLYMEDPSDTEALQGLMEEVAVHAAGPDTLVVELEFPASYFLSMTPMWTLSAVPAWTVEEHGELWIDTENIVTSGRYVLESWERGVGLRMVRNPFVPEDMSGRGNIEVVEAVVVPDPLTVYQLWLGDEVDISPIPGDELANHLEEFPNETQRSPSLATIYVGYRMTKPPIDDPRVRRALSAAIDRETLVRDVLQGQAFSMIHFAPPGIFGAPAIDEVGVGFDPQFARDQLAAAGYPNCEGLPQLFIIGGPGSDAQRALEFFQAQWQEHLGCSADQLAIEQLPFADMLAATAPDVPDSQAPHMYSIGWGADYPDEENWVGSVLWCEQDTRTRRTCSEVDDWIVEARQEPDRQRRIELYRQIEQAFFGPEGEYPIMPLFTPYRSFAQHAWVQAETVFFGGDQFYHWVIDWEAKQAAQGE